MKTRAQFLLIGLLSIVPPFPQESEARLFAARLIGVEEEASPQVQLSDSEYSNFSADKEDELDHFNRGVNINFERALDDEHGMPATSNAMKADKEELWKARLC